ncbi:MAG: aminopeptidase P family protein [Ignavibacteria bacterium]|jgi:Xaa-Pro aminopeptidase|nr:aminopeptidase P family protein [Ignavibacteria bacterium]MCU7504339.1 aminopeptidase P family protein [Ignavibacteria bacterium]MCU7518184.1 aminopeptidase P family protein [Ignavibacteria bacterium]
MSKEMIKEKIAQAVKILREKNIDMWLIFVRESSNIKDPSMDMVVGTSCTWQSAYIITKDGDTTAILGSLDVANMRMQGTYKNVVGYLRYIKDTLVGTINKYRPNKIAINFSRDSSLADGLTHGMYLELVDYLKDTPYLERLISSEEIISALRGRKTTSELDIMKHAIEETLKIIDETTHFIRPGVSEKEVAAYMKSLVKQRGFGLAWEADYCPSVFSGPDTAGAHAGPTDRKVEPGHVLNIDFGISYQGYCSDLQRTWYVLKDGEDKAPEEVLRGFNVIKDSIKLSAENIKPGRQGYEIDDIARKYITDNGYEEYPHALGHQVGRMAHDGGGLLAPKWERYGDLPFKKIEQGEVYTIEPRLPIKDFGIATIEEEVVVTENGCEFLSSPQQEIIIVR